MSSSVRSVAFFSDVCRARLRHFLDDVTAMRLAAGDCKQTITFGVSSDLESVEFRYHQRVARLECISPYQFPDTEKDLIEIVGDRIRDIRLTGPALKASSNAMAMISGDYADIVRLSSFCRFQSGEKAVFTFPIRYNWSTADLIRETRSCVPFDIGKIKVERHRFVLLEKFERQLYGDWVLCVLDSPKSSDQTGTWTLTFPGGKRLLLDLASFLSFGLLFRWVFHFATFPDVIRSVITLQCCLREICEEIGLVGDLEALQRTLDLACVSVDDMFCAFILHPNHFITPQIAS